MSYIKGLWGKSINTLRGVDWKNVLALCLLSTSIAIAYIWVDEVLRSSLIRVEYAEKIKTYAGKLEEENQAVRELLSETINGPEAWGLKFISEIVMPRVNVDSGGLPKGKEKIFCETINKMLEGFGETLLHDSKSAELTPQQKSFIFKLIRAESKYFNSVCREYI